jgi:CheY-like chemotaxis protein
MVLIVDDEPIVRKMATHSLERHGYSVVTAEDGREGLERFRELHSQLKIVILDLTMPVMSGEEALQKMRLIDPRLPVVLSSGYNEVEAIRRFTEKDSRAFCKNRTRRQLWPKKYRLFCARRRTWHSGSNEFRWVR